MLLVVGSLWFFNLPYIVELLLVKEGTLTRYGFLLVVSFLQPGCVVFFFSYIFLADGVVSAVCIWRFFLAFLTGGYIIHFIV